MRSCSGIGEIDGSPASFSWLHSTERGGRPATTLTDLRPAGPRSASGSPARKEVKRAKESLRRLAGLREASDLRKAQGKRAGDR